MASLSELSHTPVMSGDTPEESKSAREAREAAERRRAAWIVLGTTILGMLALIVAAVVLTQP